jgi:hypothetical protein
MRGWCMTGVSRLFKNRGISLVAADADMSVENESEMIVNTCLDVLG